MEWGNHQKGRMQAIYQALLVMLTHKNGLALFLDSFAMQREQTCIRNGVSMTVHFPNMSKSKKEIEVLQISN